MADGRPIVFASDFGLENEWVGICHAAIASVSPGSRVIDLSHNIEAL
jgi:S-adenosyl-L-methionine hydrolase (adenosine-forming)